MKKLSLLLVLFSLPACEGSTAKGFWGSSAPTGVWNQEQTPLCKFYGNCDSDGGTDNAATAPDDKDGNTGNSSWEALWGKSGNSGDGNGSNGNDSGGTKSCELYGNCE